MAFVGDLFRANPRPAFAHLKLTSGVSSALGFVVLPQVSLRAAALVSLGVVCCGELCFLRLHWRLGMPHLSGGVTSLLPVGAPAPSSGSSTNSQAGT